MSLVLTALERRVSRLEAAAGVGLAPVQIKILQPGDQDPDPAAGQLLVIDLRPTTVAEAIPSPPPAEPEPPEPEPAKQEPPKPLSELSFEHVERTQQRRNPSTWS